MLALAGCGSIDQSEEEKSFSCVTSLDEGTLTGLFKISCEVDKFI